MKQSEEAVRKPPIVLDSEGAWKRCCSTPEQVLVSRAPRVLEVSVTSHPSRLSRAWVNFASRADFLLYMSLMGALAFASFTLFSTLYGSGEVGDRWFFLSLPVIAEISHWASRFISSRFANTEECSVASPIGFDMFLFIVPALLGCFAFMVSSSSPYIGIGVFLVLAGYQFIRSRLSRLRFMELLEVPLGLALVCYAFSMMVMLSDKDVHHWSFFLGPVYAVVGGGHLLWDVPSQYGFLNILSIATLSRIFGVEPILSMSIFLIALQGAGVLLTFYLLRFRVGFTTLVSSILVCVLQLCLPGWIDIYSGPAFAPNASALRFMPSIAALVCVDWAMRRTTATSILCSSLLIAISCLWSPESALYTGAPIGAALLFSFLKRPQWSLVYSPCMKACAFAALIAGSFVGAYALSLPHGVDLRGFYEYAQAYSTFSGVLPMAGNMWTALFVGVIAIAYFVARSKSREGGEGVSQAVMFTTYVFCISTYFVARSADRNVHNIIPWAFTIVAAITVDKRSLAAKARAAFILVLCSLCLGLFISLYHDDNRTRIWHRQVAQEAFTPPQFEKVPVAIAQAARETVQSSLFTVLHGRALFQSSPELGAIGHALPISPIAHFTVLPALRLRDYTQRMLERMPTSYVLCQDRVCNVIPLTFASMQDLITVTEVPFPMGSGWKIFELKRR